MKAWMMFTMAAILLVWLFSRRQDDGGPPPPPPPPRVEKAPQFNQPVFKIDDAENIPLAKLLEKSRKDLDDMANEKEQQIVAQDKLRQEGTLIFNLLPGARFPMVLPIWQHARFSQKLQMIVPPYFDDATYDAVLALHLARYGDVEAARKLVPPGDTATRAEIDRLTLSRNFPAEWTRLVALMIHRAHYSFAEGNNEGVALVASLHKQLLELFDEETRQSALGSALLSRGRFLLHQAVVVWSENEQQERWIEMASESLANWGETAAPLPPAQNAEELARIIGGKVNGLLVSGGNPRRALDLLSLPLPDEALQDVVGYYERTGRLQEMLVVYNPVVVELQEPRPFVAWSRTSLADDNRSPHLSYWLEEQLAWKYDATYRAEVHRSFANAFVGPLVCILPRQDIAPLEPSPGQNAKFGSKPLPRNFGLVDLGRTFEGNRRFFGWNQFGSRIVVNDPKQLGELTLPFPDQKVSQAVLVREPKSELLGEFQLALVRDTSAKAKLVDIAGPFWEIAGSSQINVTGKMSDSSIEFIWQDATTRLCLRLPHSHGESIRLEASDASSRAAADRLKEARKVEQEERNARWKDQKLVTRVPRRVEGFELGAGRADLKKSLGKVKTLRQDLGDGCELLTFPTSQAEDPDWILRQGVVRFDDGRLTEARLRFVDGPGKKAGSAQLLLRMIRDRAGAPEVLMIQGAPPGTDAKKADDKKANDADPKPFIRQFRWHDDATMILARADEYGVEITLKDCPQQFPDGKSQTLLNWLPRGPGKECTLGMSKAWLFKYWQITTPVLADDAIVLNPGERSPYDAVLVWLDKEQKVTRIVARQRPIGDVHNAADAGKAVTQIWAQQAQAFGWPWIQNSTRRGVLAWSNRDDVTSLRVFWQETENGPRVFTEWK